MKVEVLYVANCPWHGPAVRLVQEALATHGIAANIDEVLVTDGGMAGELRFLGSPTIRINGRDVAGESSGAETFGLTCRIYPGARQCGLPPVEMVNRAVIEAVVGDRK